MQETEHRIKQFELKEFALLNHDKPTHKHLTMTLIRWQKAQQCKDIFSIQRETKEEKKTFHSIAGIEVVKPEWMLTTIRKQILIRLYLVIHILIWVVCKLMSLNASIPLEPIGQRVSFET